MQADGYERLRKRYFGSGKRPSLALFTYGSLLIRRELMNVFDPRRVSVRAVRVDGLRRDFNVDIGRWLEDPPADRTGVLNVREEPDAWCNGLLVLNVGPAGFRRYAEREFGYRLTRLDPTQVQHPFLDGSRPPSGVDVYTCRVSQHHTNDELAAYPPYRTRCLRGVRSWGTRFHRNFLKTTYSRGRRLRETGTGEFRTC